MDAVSMGDRPPPKRKGRATLSVRDPFLETLLAGVGVEGEILNELRAVGKMLLRDRNRWDVARRRSGLFGERRIKRSEADHVLKKALSAIDRGDAE